MHILLESSFQSQAQLHQKNTVTSMQQEDNAIKPEMYYLPILSYCFNACVLVQCFAEMWMSRLPLLEKDGREKGCSYREVSQGGGGWGGQSRGACCFVFVFWGRTGLEQVISRPDVSIRFFPVLSPALLFRDSLLPWEFSSRSATQHVFSPHPPCPTVLIRMTKRKTATIDSHTPLWAALAHFNSVLMHHVSIKTLIMWQRQPQGQIASNRLGVIFIRAGARWRLRLNVCGLLDVCISCSFWSL